MGNNHKLSVAVGIHLSRETMESVPRFSQWLVAAPAVAVHSDSGSTGFAAFVGSFGTDAALSRLRSFPSPHSLEYLP